MQLEIIENNVIITFVGQEQLWSLKHELIIPLSDIKKVHTSEVTFKFTALKMGGTALPGFYAGRFWTKRQGMWYKEFWYVNCRKPQLIIELKDGPVNWFFGCFGAPYMRVILGSYEAEKWKKLLNSKLKKKQRKA